MIARLWIILLVACSTVACQAYTLVEPGRRPIGALYSVSPDIPWSSATVGELEIWTVDGVALEAVRFSRGLADGEPLFDDGAEEEQRAVFRSTMTETEVVQLVEDSIARLGAGKVEATNLAPAAFGSRDGFRFDLSFRTGDGLEMRGTAVGAIAEGKLLLMLYSAAALHYFDKYAPHVEHLIASLESQ